MRNTVAKKIRNEARMVSPPTQRKSKWYSKFIPGKYDDKGRPVIVDKETVVCTGYRRTYQDMKKAYMQR